MQGRNEAADLARVNSLWALLAIDFTIQACKVKNLSSVEAIVIEYVDRCDWRAS